MRILLAALLVFLFNSANSQKGIRFHSQNYAGIVQGSQSPAVQLQSINGFQKQKWFGGIGAGLDYYLFRSVPLFLSVTRYVSLKDRSFFLTADGGTNFVWDDNTATSYNQFRKDGDFTPSWYFGGSAGYKIGLKNKRDAVLLNIGYSAKYLRESFMTTTECLTPPCLEYTDRYDYRLKRLSIKVGWQF